MLIDSLLPSASDCEAIVANFVVLAGRVLHDAISALNKIPGLITKHIQHCHYKKSSSKSEIVSAIAHRIMVSHVYVHIYSFINTDSFRNT